MVVDNRIRVVKTRSNNIRWYEPERIVNAILGAVDDAGGYEVDLLEGITNEFYTNISSATDLAKRIEQDVSFALNAEEIRHSPSSQVEISTIQEMVIKCLHFHGLTNIAEAYRFFSSGRNHVRTKIRYVDQGSESVKDRLTNDDFAMSPFPEEKVEGAGEWFRSRGYDTIEGLNEVLRQGGAAQLIADGEQRYQQELENAISQLPSKPDARLLIVAGPSSSGKTTTTEKFCEALSKPGRRFVKFHVDDYFFDICLHKPDQFGDRDYEQANALEVELINEHIAALLRGESINTPGYDFNLQRRVGGPQVQLGDDDVLVVDSHCGLFPDLTASVPDHLKFKVLLNIYSHIDDIPYTDFNMLRRMFRDSWNRGHEPFKTVRGWHYVRRGVLSDILPFHKTADAHIDGGLVTDLPVMMSYLHEKMHEESQIPTLPGGANPVSLDAYIRFQRVQEYLEKVEQLPVSDWNQLIPESSLIREFIGAA